MVYELKPIKGSTENTTPYSELTAEPIPVLSEKEKKAQQVKETARVKEDERVKEVVDRWAPERTRDLDPVAVSFNKEILRQQEASLMVEINKEKLKYESNILVNLIQGGMEGLGESLIGTTVQHGEFVNRTRDLAQDLGVAVDEEVISPNKYKEYNLPYKVEENLSPRQLMQLVMRHEEEERERIIRLTQGDSWMNWAASGVGRMLGDTMSIAVVYAGAGAVIIPAAVTTRLSAQLAKIELKKRTRKFLLKHVGAKRLAKWTSKTGPTVTQLKEPLVQLGNAMQKTGKILGDDFAKASPFTKILTSSGAKYGTANVAELVLINKTREHMGRPEFGGLGMYTAAFFAPAFLVGAGKLIGKASGKTSDSFTLWTNKKLKDKLDIAIKDDVPILSGLHQVKGFKSTVDHIADIATNLRNLGEEFILDEKGFIRLFPWVNSEKEFLKLIKSTGLVDEKHLTNTKDAMSALDKLTAKEQEQVQKILIDIKPEQVAEYIETRQKLASMSTDKATTRKVLDQSDQPLSIEDMTLEDLKKLKDIEALRKESQELKVSEDSGAVLDEEGLVSGELGAVNDLAFKTGDDIHSEKVIEDLEGLTALEIFEDEDLMLTLTRKQRKDVESDKAVKEMKKAAKEFEKSEKVGIAADFKLLGPETQENLGLLIEKGDLPSPNLPSLTIEGERIISKEILKGKAAADEIIIAHSGIVDKIAGHILKIKGLDIAESRLLKKGNDALESAVRAYDPVGNPKFTAHAVKKINEAIIKEVESTSATLKAKAEAVSIVEGLTKDLSKERLSIHINTKKRLAKDIKNGLLNEKKLFLRNTGLAVFHADRLAKGSPEDFRGVVLPAAYEGLARAVRNYDYRITGKFSKSANAHIKGKIKSLTKRQKTDVMHKLSGKSLVGEQFIDEKFSGHFLVGSKFVDVEDATSAYSKPSESRRGFISKDIKEVTSNIEQKAMENLRESLKREDLEILDNMMHPNKLSQKEMAESLGVSQSKISKTTKDLKFKLIEAKNKLKEVPQIRKKKDKIDTDKPIKTLNDMVPEEIKVG